MVFFGCFSVSLCLCGEPLSSCLPPAEVVRRAGRGENSTADIGNLWLETQALEQVLEVEEGLAPAGHGHALEQAAAERLLARVRDQA